MTVQDNQFDSVEETEVEVARDDFQREPDSTTAEGGRRAGLPKALKALIGIAAALLIVTGVGVGGFYYQRSQEKKHFQQAGQLMEDEAWDEAIAGYTAALDVWPGAARQHDVQSLHGRGACYLGAGQFDQAIADLDAALAADPGLEDVYWMRAQARYEQAEHLGALAELDRFLSENEDPAAYLMRAQIWLGYGIFDEAAADADRAANLDPTLSEAHIVASRAYLYQAAYQRAEEAADRACDLEADSAAAHLHRGAARLLMGELDGAEADLLAAQELEDAPGVQAFRGGLLLAQGDPAGAEEATGAAITDGDEGDPVVALAYAWRAMARVALDDLEEASADADRAVEALAHPISFLAQGMVKAAEGDDEEAWTALQRALELDPDLAEALACRAGLLLGLNGTDDALADIDRAIELDDGQHGYYALRASIRSLQPGRDQFALADLDRAIQLNPDEADYYAARADIHRLQGSSAAAVADLEQLVVLGDDPVEVLRIILDIHMADGAFEEALAAADRLVEAAPQDVAHHLRHADVAEALGDNKMLHDDLAAALALTPDDAAIWLRRAALWESEGELEAAVTGLGHVLALGEELVEAYAWRGRLYYELGDPRAARPNLDKAIELDPDHVTALGYRGRVRLDSDMAAEAVADLNRALELAPDWSEAYVWRAEAFLELDDAGSALRDCDVALDLNPESVDALLTRINAHYYFGDLEAALADANQAVELAPDDARSYNARGEAHSNLDELDKALEDLDRAIELDPELADAYMNRGIVYDLLGDYEAALADDQVAAELEPDYADHYFNLAIDHASLGDYEAALDAMDRYVELEPDDWTGYWQRAYVYEQMGEVDLALEELERALEVAEGVDAMADIESYILELAAPSPAAGQAVVSWAQYSDSGGAFSFSYPAHWSIMSSQPGLVVFTGPLMEEPIIWIGAEVPYPGLTLSAFMGQMKANVLSDLPGYSPISDETLTINGLPAVRHTFQCTENGTRLTGVLVAVQGSSRLGFLVATMPASATEAQRPVLDRIIYSWVVY